MVVRAVKIAVLFVLVWIISDAMNIVHYPDNQGYYMETSQVTGGGSYTLNEVVDPPQLSGLVDPAITAIMRKWELPGVAFAIADHGEIIYEKGFGISDQQSGDVVHPGSLFRIASVSKLITATAILKLCEMGKLSLDQHVFGNDGVLDDPLFLHARDSRVYQITIRDLLLHEGGWTTHWGDQMFMPQEIERQEGLDHTPDLTEIVQWVLSKKLHFTPGTAYSYSNLGYSVLGLVIEKAAGMSYEHFVQSRILYPLGITHMVLGSNLPQDRKNGEVSYYSETDTLVPPSYDKDILVPESYKNDIQTLGAAGGWLATAPDLCRFIGGIDRDPTIPDILSGRSIDVLEGLFQDRPSGWRYRESDGDLIRTGSFTGTFAMIKLSPEGYTWVFLSNTRPWIGSVFARRVEHRMVAVEKYLPGILNQRNIETAKP